MGFLLLQTLLNTSEQSRQLRLLQLPFLKDYERCQRIKTSNLSGSCKICFSERLVHVKACYIFSQA